MAKATKTQKVNNPETPVSVPAVVPSRSYTLFRKDTPPAAASGKVKVLSTQIVSPKDMTPGDWFQAKITGFSESPVSTYKNRLIEFVTPDGSEFKFPMMAVIARCLGLVNGKKVMEGKEAEAIEKQWIGRTLLIQYTGEKQGQDASKKPTKLFNVAEITE